FFDDGRCLLGRICLSRFDDPGICGTVVADARRADALIARDADVLETRNLGLGQLMLGESALQEATPFGLAAGLGAAFHNEIEAHVASPCQGIIRTLLLAPARLRANVPCPAAPLGR